MQKAALFQENYHLAQAAAIKRSVTTPIILVGGLRKRAAMESIIQKGQADFLAMSRPFIRQANLVNRFIEHQGADIITCVNCNRCTVEITLNNKPLRCYYTA